MGLSAVFNIGGTSIMIPVVDTAVHPSYDGSIFHGYDVGVLTLDGPAPAEVERTGTWVTDKPTTWVTLYTPDYYSSKALQAEFTLRAAEAVGRSRAEGESPRVPSTIFA